MALSMNNEFGDDQTQSQQTFAGTSGPGSAGGQNEAFSGSEKPYGPSLINLISQAEAPASLTESGRAYVEALEKLVRQKASSRNLNIKITRLDTLAVPSILFECNGQVIPVLVPGPNSGLNEDTPPMVALRDIMNVYWERNKPERAKTTSAVSIDDNSYGPGYVEAMACGIINIFHTNTIAQQIDLTALKQQRLHIDTSLSAVTQYFQAWSPHAVMPRTEFGFVLSAVPQNYNPNNKASKGSFYDSMVSGLIPLAAVSGYVELINENRTSQAGTPLFTPVVHISEVSTQIPSLRMLELLICIFSNLSVSRRFWQRQFENFAENEPNIGNMIFDGTKTPPEPYRVSSLIELDAFLRNSISDPCIVMDVVDGRFRIPGIEMFAMQDKQQLLLTELGGLINTELPKSQVSAALWSEYIGVFADNNAIPTDSRYLDYLRLMVNNKHQSPAVLPFATRIPDADPKARVQALRNFYPTLRVTNNCTTVTFNPALLKFIQDIIAPAISVSSTMADGQSSVNLSEWTNRWRAYGTAATFGTAAAPGGFGMTSFQSGVYNW